MSEKAKYVSIDGTELNFGSNKLYMGESGIRGYNRSVNVKNNQIYSLTKDRFSLIQIPCYIKSDSTEFRNRFFDVIEKDVIYKNENPKSKKTGKLYIGDYYLPGFFISASSSYYLVMKHFLSKQLVFVPSYENWIREKKYTIVGCNTTDAEGGVEFPFDFPFDYSTNQQTVLIDNNSISKSKFKMVVSGPASNPSISIGSSLYSVDVVLLKGEFLTIDSFNEEIYVTAQNEQRINCFSKINENYNIFEPIIPGRNAVSANQNMCIELTLYQERSEPEWI